MPVQVEHRLPCPGTDVDDHAVVLAAFGCSNLGDEPQHSTGLFIRKGADFAERIDVSCGQDEQVSLRSRRDITNCHEAIRLVHVIAIGDKPTEQAGGAIG